MAEYAYISKDESYALKHYGIKGMKWHKHLKQQRIALLGTKKAFGYAANNLKRSYDGAFNGGPNKSINYLARIGAKHGPDTMQKANVERSNRMADFYVKKGFSEAEAEINNKERAKAKAKKERREARQKKKQQKKDFEKFLEKGRSNAAKEKISVSSPLIEKAKEKKRQISKRKTRIPGVTDNGYIKEPQTISGSRKRRRRR